MNRLFFPSLALKGQVEVREIRFISSSSGPAAPPTAQQQPLQQAVKEGDAVSFSVSALGTAPFTYHWRREVAGVFKNLSNGPNVTGAAARVLTPAAATPGARRRRALSDDRDQCPRHRHQLAQITRVRNYLPGNLA